MGVLTELNRTEKLTDAEYVANWTKFVQDYESMSNEWKEAVEGQNHKVYQDYIAAKESLAQHGKFTRELGVLNGTRKALTMLILLSLLARYGRMMFV